MDISEPVNFMRNPGFKLQYHTDICGVGYHDTAFKLIKVMSCKVWSREDVNVIKRMKVIGQLIQDAHKLFGEMHSRELMCTINRMTLPIDNLSYIEVNYPFVCGCRTWDPIFGIMALINDLFGELLLIYDIVPSNSHERLLFDKLESMLDWKQKLHVIKGILSDAPKYMLFWSERSDYGASNSHQTYLIPSAKSTLTNDDLVHDIRIPRQEKKMFEVVSFYDPQTTHMIWTLDYLIPELTRTKMAIASINVSSFRGFQLENMYKRIKIFDPGGLIIIFLPMTSLDGVELF
ncbi:hypothetical protein KFK09_016153 [Dendrobium nobile]|uniref:Uncharacterized protein n=1 Tax=Dendrobium nobile TaxID=94219 RepID=A0A8T3AYL3_DENNO|nr:hypothetical protein KFK09_016153 [Dendrobium nobile]